MRDIYIYNFPLDILLEIEHVSFVNVIEHVSFVSIIVHFCI